MKQIQRSVNTFSLTPARTALFLGLISLIFVIASLAGQLTKYVLFPEYVSEHSHVEGLIRLFDLNQERNAPTVYSFCLLLLSFLLLLIIGILEKKHFSRDASKWIYFSIFLFFMMSDEMFTLHEKLIDPMRSLINADHLGILYYAWVIPGIIIVVLFILFFYRFFSRLEKNIKNTFQVAGTIYLGGAIGIEFIGGDFEELYGSANILYSLITTIEESLEMAGIIIFIKGLLTYLQTNYKTVTIDFATS